MRILILKQGQDLQALSNRLGDSASVQHLRALNPHLDLGRLEAGTVLLVPDGIDDAQPVGGAVFDGLADDVKEGMKAAISRVQSTQAQSAALRKEVSGVLKSAAFKRLLESDTDLRKQTAAAETRFKLDQAAGKQTEESLSALKQVMEEETAALARLFR